MFYKPPLIFYAIYKIPKTIVNIANTIDNITVHLFCFPSFVLPLFFSKKLFVDEPVIVDDNPASSFDCINVNIIKASDIIKYIREKYKLLVGDRTAEEIKFQIGTVFPGSKNEKMEVRGRDLVTGLPHTITLTSDEVEEALRESAYVIVNTAKSVLEQTPPELSADIIDKGIVITGGGALLDGIDELLSHELKVPVFVAESPLTCVVEGTGVLLENIPLLESGLNKNY